MAKETFIMMSLDEEKSKDLAKVIGSKTSRIILDYLGSHDKVSEAQIAKKLGLPVSTVHYNVKHLLKAGLIENVDFAWSEKGKKIELYNVAKKLIIIAPKGAEGLTEQLKRFLPITFISFFASGALYLWQKFGQGVDGTVQMVSKSAGAIEEMALDAAAPSLARATEAVPEQMHLFAQTVPQELNYALWFLLGSLFVIIISFFYFTYRKK